MRTRSIIPHVASVQLDAAGAPVYITVWRRDYSALAIADALRMSYPKHYMSALVSPISAPYPTYEITSL